MKLVRIPGPIKPINNKPQEVYSERVAELHGASDRVCAIVWGAEIQDQLQRALTSVLVKRSEHAGALIAFDGPLGNFRLMNDLAHTIGMITDDVWNDIENVREIRNAFAHKVTVKDSTRKQKLISFKSDKVKHFAKRLRCPEIVFRHDFSNREQVMEWIERMQTGEPMAKRPSPTDPRERFEWTCSQLENVLNCVEWFDHLLILNNQPRGYHIGA